MYVLRIYSVDSLKHAVCVDLRIPKPTLLDCSERFVMRLCLESLRICSSGGTPRDFKIIDDAPRIKRQGMDEVTKQLEIKEERFIEGNQGFRRGARGVNPDPPIAHKVLLIPSGINFITFLSLHA